MPRRRHFYDPIVEVPETEPLGGRDPRARIWGPPPQEPLPLEETEPSGQIEVRAIQADPGVYMHVDDIKTLLRGYADQFEQDKNPSGALALREAADQL